MTAKMLNGGEDCVGSMTTGGTESILMATKTYRELGRARGITQPEMSVSIWVNSMSHYSY